MRSEVMKRKNLWQTYSEAQLEKLEKTNALYRVCLDEGKTERECVQKTIELARAQGYEDMKQLIKAGKKIRTGDKVYMDYMGKMKDWLFWIRIITVALKNTSGFRFRLRFMV